MRSQTCAYVASKDDPERWHGEDSSEFWLDRDPEHGGLEISEWRCPHPPLGEEENDEECCVFHTETEVSADYQKAELLEALDEAGDGPEADRPEHRGQFIGATFGAIDLSGETITATDDHDVRFDHAEFRAGDESLDFTDTTFVTQGDHRISFYGTEFITDGDGDVWFRDARFRTTGGNGQVGFRDATFRTDGFGFVGFKDTTFRTTGQGNVWLEDATFRTDGEGDVWFGSATFRTTGNGDVGFRDARFKTTGAGNVKFRDVTLTNIDFRRVDFAKTGLQGANLTGSDLQEATVEDISVDGATTCEQLYEGYKSDRSPTRSAISSRLRRLLRGSTLTSEEWDATARAYHQLKTAFSKHGLVGKARDMHVRERRARSLEAKAENRWVNRRYLKSLPSRVFTGYGVQVTNLVIWMLVLFLISTSVYVYVGVEGTLVENIAYSVLAFTVAPPEIPRGVELLLLTQFIMMFETFFGTLSIVLLGYILGNRERF